MRTWLLLLIVSLSVFVSSGGRAAELQESTGGVSHDSEMLRNLAETGEISAQVLLGEMLLRGDGVDKNPKEAFRWFLLAAQRGSVDAQRQLGFMYEGGIGVKQDLAEASRWFAQAGERGDSVSRYKAVGVGGCP